MKIETKQTLAKVALFSATLIWGSSFFVMKNTLDEVQTFYLLAMRFTVGAVVLALVFINRMKAINMEYVLKGSLMGGLLFCAYTAQTIGLTDTTPGKNAFLTAVYCVIVPFLYWLISKKRPDIFNFIASFVCIAGIGFVSLDRELMMGMGDTLTLVGGLFYALHIVAVASFSKNRDIFLLTAIQFASAAVLGWIFGLLFNDFPQKLSTGSIISLVYLCFLATAVALLLQNIGQKYTHPSTAAIILSLESVFGVLFSIVFYHEALTPKIAIGFTLIFFAVIISETKLEFLKRKKKKVK